MTKGNDLKILPFDQLPEWDGFVESHVKGTIYHTSAMIRTMALTKGNSPFSHAAVDQLGRICAMLVAVKVSTLGRWADPFAARSIFYAEPIYLNTIDGQNGVMQLVRHHDRYMRGRTLFAEVRPFYAPPVEDDPWF